MGKTTIQSEASFSWRAPILNTVSHDSNSHCASKMDDDEIQFVEVTVHSGSPIISRKRKRKESLRQPTNTQTQLTPSNGDIVFKAAQLKRRLAFCEKEQEELAKRFKEIKEQLTKEQSCALDVKLEDSDKHVPLICVGDNSDDDEVVFILPEDYSPLKRRKLEDEKTAEKSGANADQPKKDVAITYYKPATNLPHAREHCAVHKFVQSNVTTATVSCNESYCEQCYCYACDAPVKECDSWTSGTNPHCNGYAKNSFWEKLRKMAKRKTSAAQDSLLKCLPVDEQTESLKSAAEKVTELLETLKGELNDSSNNFNSPSSSPSCRCDCHYDSDGSYGSYDGEGCYACCDEHESRCVYDWPFSRYGRLNSFSLSDNVSNTVSKAMDYLKSDEPGQAAVVLDALTVVLLAADNERNRWHYGQVNSALRSLRKAWIEVLMHPDLPKNVEDKVRERIKNAICGALICSSESTGLKVVLDMKKWSDESLVKCLAGKLGDDLITEDEEVVEARMAFLEKNKRFSDALSYMLGCKVTLTNRGFGYYSSAASEQKLANMSSYRHKLILFLVKTGKIDQALNVITLPQTAELPKEVLTNTTPKVLGSNVNYSQSTLGRMSLSSMKEILSAIINDGTSSSVEPQIPLPRIIPEEKMKKVLALILTGAQVNSCLRGDTALEWYINTFCETSLSNHLSKNVRQSFIKEAEQFVSKAKNRLLAPSEIKPPFNGVFKVFVVELFAALAVGLSGMTTYYQAYSTTGTLQVFKRKNLPWACVSMVLSPTMANKITHTMLTFVVDNLIKPLGSNCIPLEVYQSWIKKVPDINGIEKNFEIALYMLKEGKRKPGSSLCNDAVLLVKDIIGIMDACLNVNKSYSSNKDNLAVVLKRMKKEFGFALKDDEWRMTSFCFKNDPSYANFKSVENTCKKEKWPQLRTSMIDFLKQRRTSHTGCCVDVFAQCLMFSEVKLTLTATGYVNNYSSICDKIKQTLPKLKKDDACRFVDVCADWLGSTLCNAGFRNWRHGYTSIPEAMLSCLKAIADVKMQTFTNTLSAAVHEVAGLFCNNTVSAKHRSDLERWLKDIKNLYRSKEQLTEWSWAFHFLTTGKIKRKPTVIRQLKNSSVLMSGTIPYHQLIKLPVASNTATNTSNVKPAQGTAVRTQAVNMAASTPKNILNAKPAQGTAMRTQAVNMAASTPKNIPNAKPAQGTAVRTQAVNMAASTPKNIPNAKPAQGTAVRTQAVNMAASTPKNIPNAKPAQGTAVRTQAVNMAASTPKNIPNAKPAQGTATPQQAVYISASRPSNTSNGKPAQGNATPKQVNAAVSTPNNNSNAKATQGKATTQAVNMAASTLNNTSSAKPTQGNPSTSQSTRVVLAPIQSVNVAASIPKPQGSLSAVKISENRVQIQLSNVNTSASTPNSTALPQQVIRLPSCATNLVANLASNNNTVQNVIIRVPQHTTKVSTTPASPASNAVPCSAAPADTLVTTGPNTTGVSLVSSASKTVSTPASTSSTVTRSVTSAGSRGKRS